jgi:hypothetical protein
MACSGIGSDKRSGGITRRFALTICGALAAAAGGRVFRPLSVTPTAEIADHVSALFSDLPGARKLGSQYLIDHPEEADAALLADLLCAPGSRSIGPAALRHNIAKLRADDFVAGRIALVDGWILARTEARACALAALT